jgi:hypothetical protein
MTPTFDLPLTSVVSRLRYRHGIPFIMSALLAALASAWPRVFGATSIWTFALLALISTAFAVLCGGRFRTFFIAVAVTPPFLFALSWFLRMRFAVPDFPSRGVIQYFLYFVAAPILLVWIVTRLVNRKQRHA